MRWNVLRLCCLQRDPLLTWLVHIVPYSFVPLWLSYVPSWRWFCCQQTNSNQKSHTHLLNGSKEVHATKRKSFWKAFRHLACTSLAPKKNYTSLPKTPGFLICSMREKRCGARAPRYSWGRSARSADPPLPPQQRKPWPCRRRSRTPGSSTPAKGITVGIGSNKGNLMEPVINSLAKLSPMTACGIFMFADTLAAEQHSQVSTLLKCTPMSRTTSPGWTHCTPDHSPPQCRNGDKPYCYSSTESQHGANLLMDKNCTRSKWERLRPWRGACWLDKIPNAV